MLLAAAASADAATRFVIHGRGFGHGVGMSQYGAYGYAKHGRSYRRILAHYYQHTTLASRRSRRVRVLLQASRGRVRFRGATRMGIGRRLDPRHIYTVRRSTRGRVALLRSDGSLIGRYRSGMSVRAGRKGIRLFGGAINGIVNGRYRTGFQFRNGRGGGVNAINRVGIDSYVRGVIAGEMPSAWHYEALKAQAVAARSFGLTSRKSGTFDHYPDQRSQVYNGIRGETARTDRAVRRTAGEVVTYRGRVVTTYFFSTSGGRTENVENVFYGDPAPYLVSVEDRYEDFAPKHRWRMSFSRGEMGRRLGAPGEFVRLDILRRGVSGRVVTARIVGTAGSKRIKGYPLRFALGLYDSWIRITRVTTAQATRVRSAGWVGDFRYRSREIAGVHAPAPRSRRLTVERRVGGVWRSSGRVRTTRKGRYRTSVPARGLYRVRSGGDIGPAVRVK
jgi:SpoIID/LytB domain protein